MSVLGADNRFKVVRIVLALILAVWLPVAQIATDLDPAPGAFLEESSEGYGEPSRGDDEDAGRIDIGSDLSDALATPWWEVSRLGVSGSAERPEPAAVMAHQRRSAFPPTGPPDA